VNVSRALTIQRSIVPLSDRKRFMEKLRTRRAYYAAANCRFWVFEETGLAGAFIEFIEADDEATLEAAIAGAPDVVAKVRAGKVQALGALVGAVMKTTRGKADAATVKRMLEERVL
jgi:hypothetical protein